MTATIRARVGLLSTIAAIVFAAIVLPRLIDHSSRKQSIVIARCDLNLGPCVVDLAMGRGLEVSLSPRPIPVMKPAELAVATRGFDAPATAEVLLTGVAMDMGFHRTVLRRISERRLGGETIIPVCVTGTMEWQLDLRIAAPGANDPIRVRFLFAAPARDG